MQTKADLVAQHQMLTTMKDRLIGLMKKGMGTDDLLAAPPTSEFDAKWGDPELFLSNAYLGACGATCANWAASFEPPGRLLE